MFATNYFNKQEFLGMKALQYFKSAASWVYYEIYKYRHKVFKLSFSSV